MEYWRTGIRTYFEGVHYRSTLEARWAFVFRQLGLRAIYEAKRFELPSGAYIPDFWFPGSDIYVEIKPKREWAELDRYAEFAGCERRRLLLIIGKPNFNELAIFEPAIGTRSRCTPYGRFAECSFKDERLWFVAEHTAVSLYTPTTCNQIPTSLIRDSEWIQAAVTAPFNPVQA